MIHPLPQPGPLLSPDSETAENLREQLAAAVELLNAEYDPDTRAGLIREISELRDRLGIVPGGTRP